MISLHHFQRPPRLRSNLPESGTPERGLDFRVPNSILAKLFVELADEVSVGFAFDNRVAKVQRSLFVVSRVVQQTGEQIVRGRGLTIVASGIFLLQIHLPLNLVEK